MAIIASWNVNSINARINHLKNFITAKKPSVILLQEIKCQAEKFPFELLDEFNYNIKICGQKGYNGVAILSHSILEDVRTSLPDLHTNWSLDARYIDAFTVINKTPVRLISVYVPNGAEVGSNKFLYKLKFLRCLKAHLMTLLKTEENVILGGDINVAPEEIDVYNPKALDGTVGFHIEERKLFRAITNRGFIDIFRALNPSTQEFSWWDYRNNSYVQNKGMRIDHILVSPSVSDMISSVEIFKEVRGWQKTSDHAPVLCKLGN